MQRLNLVNQNMSNRLKLSQSENILERLKISKHKKLKGISSLVKKVVNYVYPNESSPIYNKHIYDEYLSIIDKLFNIDYKIKDISRPYILQNADFDTVEKVLNVFDLGDTLDYELYDKDTKHKQGYINIIHKYINSPWENYRIYHNNDPNFIYDIYGYLKNKKYKDKFIIFWSHENHCGFLFDLK